LIIPLNFTGFSAMGETAEVQHAASLFLGLNKQAACSTMLIEKLVSTASY
jgi:hypothetical protein